MTGEPPFILRAGTAADADPLARILRQALTAAVPEVPVRYTPREDAAFVRNKVLAQTDVTVAEVSGEPVGFASLARSFIAHLYVAEPFWRRGIGTALVDRAKAPADRLELFTFQANASARAFYAAQGFREVTFSDGSTNEERMPDVRLLWERAADA
ncbi:MAG: GNAT family N-acetyltransferase [Pseudomonadota bacterium]